jgi:hypothetical protein
MLLSVASPSGLEQGEGLWAHFVQAPYFPSFAFIPSRDGYYILHLPRQATAWSPLGWAPGLLYIQHRTSAGVLRFASTPLSGIIRLNAHSRVVLVGSDRHDKL